MKDLIRGAISVALLVASGLTFLVGESEARVVLATQGPRYHRAPSVYELIFEGGLALPTGDQQDKRTLTRSGVGAGTGRYWSVPATRLAVHILRVFRPARFAAFSCCLSEEANRSAPHSRAQAICSASIARTGLTSRI